jgi:WD40 repeat protein
MFLFFLGVALLGGVFVAAQGPGTPPVVDWAPDGKVLIASDGLLARFDLDTGKEELLDRYGDTFAISPDGKTLALARGNVIELRSYPKLNPEVQVWPPEGETVTALAWAPDGQRLAAGTHRGKVLVWALEAGELAADWQPESLTALVRLKFSSDGKRLLAASADGGAVLLEVAEEGQLVLAQEFSPAEVDEKNQPAQQEIQDLTPNGRRILLTRVRGEESEVALLDDAGEEVWSRSGYAMEFTRDGTGVLALGWPFRIAALYSTATAEAVRVFEPPPEVGVLYFVRQSPDRTKLLGVGEDKRTQVLVLWEFETGRLLAVLR